MCYLPSGVADRTSPRERTPLTSQGEPLMLTLTRRPHEEIVVIDTETGERIIVASISDRKATPIFDP